MEVISGHFWTFRNVKKERKNLFTKMVVTLRSMDTFKLLKRLQRYLTQCFQPIRNQKRKKGWWENDQLREQNSIHFKTHLKRIILNVLFFKWKTIIILRKLQNLNPKYLTESLCWWFSIGHQHLKSVLNIYRYSTSTGKLVIKNFRLQHISSPTSVQP